MKYKLAVLIILLFTSIFSGCVSAKSYTYKIKTMTPFYGSLSGQLQGYDIVFDEGRLVTPDTTYRVREKDDIERLYKAYLNNQSVTFSPIYVNFDDHAGIQISWIG